MISVGQGALARSLALVSDGLVCLPGIHTFDDGKVMRGGGTKLRDRELGSWMYLTDMRFEVLRQLGGILVKR